MIIFLVSILLSLAVFGAMGVVYTRDGYNRSISSFKLNKKQLLAILPLFLIFLSTRAAVPANSVGILYSPFTGVREQTLSEGWKKKGIFDRLYTINTQMQTLVLDQVTGQTKDSQWINMEVDVRYKVDPDTAFQVFKQYKTLENVTNDLIPSVVQRSIESVTTKYNVIDVLGEKRNDIYTEIEQILDERLIKYGVKFDSLTLIDTDAGTAIEQAIEDEPIAKKAIETAEQKKLRTEIEAQERIINAEADKKKAIVDAETKLINAKAEADANEMLSKSITPELLKKLEVEARMKHGWVTVTGGSVITDTRTGQ